MNNEVTVTDEVEFECSNGGKITIISNDGETNLSRLGADGKFAYYEDLHLDAYSDMMINLDDPYHVEGSVKHVTGDAVMKFNLSSLEPNGKVDVKLSGLSPENWYRLRFGGNLAACEGGRAHGKTNEEGLLTFNKVEIPNE
jgi:hypothetical protein